MTTMKYIKLMMLILGLALLNIVVLSPGLLGIEIGGDSALGTALGITLLLMSLVVLLYGSYILLFKPSLATPTKEIRTHDDYLDALTYYSHKKALGGDITLAVEQLNRIKKKSETLLSVLNQRFDPNELSYKKFHSVILEVEKLFYLNVRGILNRLGVFDESEFQTTTNQRAKQFSQELIQEKTNIYNEYMTFVKGSLEGNEEILLKLDKLLLEISRLDSLEIGDIENMPCMQEIDSLIKQTKFYRQ
ncbi:MAG: hypothetical protein H7X86_02455 [Gorillibacterium sp.]|nr:hypothetical protein [Gorillibacterium sp.]